MAERFFDTNVLLYLLSAETAKADWVEANLPLGGVVSVQVLNEFASVATRKSGLSIAHAQETLEVIQSVCEVVPLTLQTHQHGLQLAERYRYSIYDAMILASALSAGCRTILTEDLQHGQIIEKVLTVRNPFKK